MNDKLHLKFKNPDQKIEGEGRSKLLDETCTLALWVSELRTKLTHHGIIFDARPMHIELCLQFEEEEQSKRANALHNTYINPQIFVMVEKALIVYTGIVNLYGMTHCTIAYFKEGLTMAQYEILQKIATDTCTEDDISSFKLAQQKRISTTQAVNVHKDWWCSTCRFKIFGSKPKCFKCGSLRPS
jgi:hypothetical protein